MNKPTILLSGALLAVLVGASLYPAIWVAPGQLSKGHQKLTAHCFECHEPFRGASPDKCKDCHLIQPDGRLITSGERLDDKSSTPFHHRLIEKD